MSAFSDNRRRILSLWLPRLPIDRIKHQLAVKAFSSESLPRTRSGVGTGSREENASKEKSIAALDETPDETPSVVVAKENNALQIYSLDDAAARSVRDGMTHPPAGSPLAVRLPSAR